jgi:hypothetical protein
MNYIRLHPLKVPILLLGIAMGYLVNQISLLGKATPPTNGGHRYESRLGMLASKRLTTEKQQPAAQENNDVSECYEVAKSRTGIDPNVFGQSGPTANGKTKPPQTASEALMQAGNASKSVATQTSTDESPNQNEVAIFNAANLACLQARGYPQGPAALAKPDVK